MPIENLSDLQLFLSVCRTQNLSAAGRQLGLSPALVSKRLQRLEEGLGNRLFYRSTRQVTLTAAGETLMPYAEKALNLLQQAEAQLTDPSQLSGRLRLTTSVSFGKKYVMPLVERFMAEHPQVRLQLHLDDQNLSLLEQGFDLAIRFGDLPDSSLSARHLFTSQRLICASPDYLAKAGRPEQPEDLLQHRCLVLNQQDVWCLRKADQQREIQVSAMLSLNSGEVLRDLVVQGHGLAKLALWHLYDQLVTGEVVPVLSDWEVLPAFPAWLVYPSRELRSPALHRFMELALEALRPLGEMKIPEPQIIKTRA